jgi:6-pyruvoyltetrahydropterin/6-carboxytetrahydropterin synthase
MMQHRIGKKFEFAASHQLTLLPPEHKCSRMHGHNYEVVLTICAPLGHEELNSVGFVKDYGELTPFKRYIDENLDHRHLNDTLGDKATAEALAMHLFNIAKRYFPDVQIYCVRVQETPNTFAEFYG